MNLTFKKKPPINSWNQPHGVRNQSNQNHQQQHHQQQAQSPTKSSLIPTQVLNKSGGVPREGGQNPLKASGSPLLTSFFLPETHRPSGSFFCLLIG